MMIPFNNLSYKWPVCFRILRHKTSSVIEVDAPGLNRSNISVQITGRKLNISGQREMNNSGREVKLVMNESFALEDFVDLDKITTEYVDGVLRVSCPMMEKYNRTVKVG